MKFGYQFQLDLALPELHQVRLLVPEDVDQQLALEGGEGDPHGGPGQVAGMVL